MTRTWYLATVIVDDEIGNSIDMFLCCWPFQWPWRSACVIQSASPNAACPGLLQKQLDATIGQLLTLYCPSSHQGNSRQNGDEKMYQKDWPF
jgi:hypothetical protein